MYAYALLFPGAGADVELQRSDPRLRLAYDLYNEGLVQGLSAPREPAEKGKVSATVEGWEATEIRLEPGTRRLPFGSLELDLDPSGLTWAGYRLEHLLATSTLEVRGLRNRYRRPGLGAPLAASLAPDAVAPNATGSKRIAARTRVPVTALMRLEDPRASLASGQVRGRLEIYAADRTSMVQVDGRREPLETDPTAALASQLDGSPLYALEIAAFLRAGVIASQLPRDRAQDGIFTLHPYQPGKIPVVLVHGTASSPVRWAELVNELEGDPRIRERYQIWVFLYETGNPIGYSAGRLRAALTAAVQEFDPEGDDAALHRMVVIGHSQGGLLTKLTAIDSGTKFWERLSPKAFDEIDVSPETRELLRQSMFFTPLPFVAKVVFVATPHRGAKLAAGGLGSFAARLVTLPTGLVSQLAQAATSTGDERLVAALRRPPTAVDNMNPSNPGILILASIPVSPQIPAHSIIAVKGDGPVEEGDDGVVVYRSAHIDEAVSERVVRSGHSVQGHPEAIEEIRRILLEHAAAPGAGDL